MFPPSVRMHSSSMRAFMINRSTPRSITPQAHFPKTHLPSSDSKTPMNPRDEALLFMYTNILPGVKVTPQILQ